VVVGGLLLLAAVGWLGFGTCYGRELHPEDVRSDISATLPRGATVDEIRAYLTARGAEFDPALTEAGAFSFLEDEGVPPETPVITGIIRDSATYPLLRKHILIYFALQPDGRLDRAYVEEIGESF
jgi:hypothetical protein